MATFCLSSHADSKKPAAKMRLGDEHAVDNVEQRKTYDAPARIISELKRLSLRTSGSSFHLLGLPPLRRKTPLTWLPRYK